MSVAPPSVMIATAGKKPTRSELAEMYRSQPTTAETASSPVPARYGSYSPSSPRLAARMPPTSAASVNANITK